MEHLELSKATYILEEEQAPACLVGLDGCIVYCNPAWDLFARENGGDPAALGQAVSGASFGSFIRGERVADAVMSYLESALRGDPASFLSECNSAEVARVILNRFEPVHSSRSHRTVGAAAVYSLVRSCPIAELHATHPVRGDLYRGGDGLIRMCAFCRRVQRRGEDGRWDFVPGYIKNHDETIVQASCGTCLAQLVGEPVSGTPYRLRNKVAH